LKHADQFLNASTIGPIFMSTYQVSTPFSKPLDSKWKHLEYLERIEGPVELFCIPLHLLQSMHDSDFQQFHSLPCSFQCNISSNLMVREQISLLMLDQALVQRL
jgi:hypothetical protein